MSEEARTIFAKIRWPRPLAGLQGITLADVPREVSAGVTLAHGPIADAFTHIGQLALLRRLAGSPVRGENYFKAEIVLGRVGPDQAAPRREFE